MNQSRAETRGVMDLTSAVNMKRCAARPPEVSWSSRPSTGSSALVEGRCRTSLVLGARIGDAPLSSATDGALLGRWRCD